VKQTERWGAVVPILKPDELDIISHGADQTQRLGARLGTLLQPGDIICLSGDMGAGKTVFTAGIGQGWGTEVPVTSPTYNLVHVHQRQKDKQRLYHLDCYRLQGAADAATIDLDELLDGYGPMVLEWPERIESVLPTGRLWITLRILEQHRRNFVFKATGTRHKALIESFRERAYGI
jgi:tRNA threonylcarbamoyladenosine biosynthesis protein TsaE